MALDSGAWGVAVWAAAAVRRLYVDEPLEPGRLVVAAALAMSAHLALGAVAGLYHRGRVRGSYEEIVRLTQVTAVVTAVLLAVALASGDTELVPGTVPVLAGVFALPTALALRHVLRAVAVRRRLRLPGAPVIVVGAGAAGRRLVQGLVEDPDAAYRPVALVDDDRGTHGRRVAGVVVRGGRESIADIASRTDVRTVVIAIPSADSQTVRELADLAHGAGLTTLVLSPGGGTPGDAGSSVYVRGLQIEDLVGRASVDVDESAITDAVSGRTVLVTGAGGSIGAELCRQIARFGPRRIALLDRDESAMNAVLLDLRGRGLTVPCTPILADVRDDEAVRQGFDEHRPEIVFHAAGLQNASMLEHYPAEAWKTNVVGTLNVLEVAAEHHVLTFVNVSTDRAQDPARALGSSRRIAERLTIEFDDRHPGRYLSVRFGDIYGSAGSVGPLFETQIRHGGPLTVSHPGAVQQFMLIPEACRLILAAAALAAGGEVMSLDMGPATRIVDVARALMRLRGRPDLEIVYTGLRPAQKLTRSQEEESAPTPTSHPLLRTHALPALDDLAVRDVDERLDVTVATMRYLALAMGTGDGPGHRPGDEGWARIEMEWSRDVVEDAPHDAFAAALLGLQGVAAAQADQAERIVDGVAPDGTREGGAGLDGPPGEDHPGGESQPQPIYLSKADVGPLEEKWVLKAMRSGYVAPLGPMVDEFERRVAERAGVAHALALSSGTAALHLLLLHVGARAGTDVVVPTMTFAATVNAVMYTGARPCFVDVREADANIDVDLMIAAVDELQAAGRTVSAVVTVDLFGRCCDYTRIEPALAARGVPLIEDAAEALGAAHRGRPAGSFGLGAALSFNGNKIMTTSGGGMLLSDDGNLIDRARHLSTQARQPVPWYEHAEVGFNYRLSNVLAGIGIAQLSRLDSMIRRRRDIRRRYAQLAAEVPGGRLLGRAHGFDDVEDNHWLTSLVYDPQAVGVPVDEVVASLGRDRVEARHLWKPLHGMAAYAGRPCRLTGAAERLFASGVNLPSGSALTDEDVERVSAAVADLLARADAGSATGVLTSARR